MGLLRCTSTFTRVTTDTTTDNVLPTRPTTLTAGDHVIEAHFTQRYMFTTVLALLVITRVQIAAIKTYRRLWHLIKLS